MFPLTSRAVKEKADSLQNERYLQVLTQVNTSIELRHSVPGADIEDMAEETLQAELTDSLEERKLNNDGIHILKQN